MAGGNLSASLNNMLGKVGKPEITEVYEYWPID